MNTESTNTKKILIALVLIFVLGFAVYFFFFRNATPVVTFDEFGNPIQAQIVGQDLIDLLNEVQSITLDTKLFRAQTFLNLTDFGIELVDQPRGRSNPFETIPGGVTIKKTP